MNFVKAKTRSTLLTLSLLGSMLSLPLSADDTEIFFSDAITSVNPNVLFVVDVSGSMDAEVSGSGGQNRLTVMQNALKTVLKTAPDNLNVGLMNYGEVDEHDEAHGVKFPVTDITALAEPVVGTNLENDAGHKMWYYSSTPRPDVTTTVRDYLSQITDWYWKDDWYKVNIDRLAVKEMDHVGVTPIVDALYEAAMYFRGEKVSFGLGEPYHNQRTTAHPSTYEGDRIEWDDAACTETYTKTYHHAIKFDENEYPWYRCPSNPSAPRSPGTYDNCRGTESCEVVTEKECKNHVDSYCRVEELVDESGESYCPDGEKVEGYCKNNEYKTETFTKCTYQICKGDYKNEPNYKTPITQACQSNFIVLLSDGEPQYSRDYDDEGDRDGTNSPPPTYENFEKGNFPAITDKSDVSVKFDHNNCDANKKPSGYRSGTCGPEMTRFLAEADNGKVDGVQTIDTYAIGFGLDGAESAQDYLKSLVSTDDPDTPEIEGYFSAEDENQLAQAFSSILSSISSTTTSFALPGYSVDLKTGLFNEEDIYIPVFDKSLSPRWSGNLKKFRLATNAEGKSVVVDKFDNVAVDDLGVFTAEAVDRWSASSVGNGREVAKGGVAELIDPNNRKAVTDLKCTRYPCDLLSNPKNLLHPSNDESNGGEITSQVLGLESGESSDTRIKMLNFIRGRTLNSETGFYDLNPHMGDMLHTEPVIVTYDEDYKSNPSENGQVIYATTNEGYLHAFNTVTGKEVFAFMPSSLMKNIPIQYYNSSIGEHAYGIDGILSKRVVRDKEGEISKVLLYFGLRRGGREYYALDVTDPEKPILVWKIDAQAQKGLAENGSCTFEMSDVAKCTLDGTLGSGDFAKLGQSWSTPYLAKIRTSDTAFTDVVIFSGGYDINQDEYQPDRAPTDNVGNEVFIVNAETGILIWALDSPQLQHSIPGGMRILDMNQDGAIDRMYFADMGGNVWRLELPMGPSYDLSSSKLIKFAELGEIAPAGGISPNNRMFFNEPDVAILRSNGVDWLTISLGSGYRAHPADNEVDDHFFVLLDNAVNSPLTKSILDGGDFKPLKLDDLEKISVTGINGTPTINRGSIGDKTILDIDKAGWYMPTPSKGEKVLAPSITVEGRVMFTTLVPPEEGVDLTGMDLCAAPVTQGRFYSLNILTGEPGSDINGDGTVTNEELMTIVTANEIPGTPQRIFNKPSCAGTECTQHVDVRVGKRGGSLTTYDASQLESVFWTNPVRK